MDAVLVYDVRYQGLTHYYPLYQGQLRSTGSDPTAASDT